MKYKQILRRIFQIHTDPNTLSDPGTNVAQEVRQYISNDLHDNIGPGLLIMRLHIEELKRRPGNANISSQIEALSRTTDELIRSTREMIWTLHPKNDSLENTVHFICDCFLSVVETTSLTPTINFPDLIPDVSLPVMLVRCLLLCVREASDFIIRSTAGTQVDFRIDVTEENIRIKMHTDSATTGLSEEEYAHALRSIERKITAVNGACSIFPASQGTTVWIKAPFAKY